MWVLSLVSTSGSILVLGSGGLHRFVSERCRFGLGFLQSTQIADTTAKADNE